MQLNRFLNVRRIIEFLDYCEGPTNAAFYLFIVRNAVFIGLVIHGNACFWFKVACNGFKTIGINENLTTVNICHEGSWALKGGLDLRSETRFSQYITSMYWSSATSCSVGYGDIHAHLVTEKALSSVLMIGGVVFFGYIIASVTASLANADASRARYKSKVDTVYRFLKEQRVRSSLSKRIKYYYQFLWNRNRGVNLETLFEGLPHSLHADITLSLYREIIESVPLFQSTEISFTKMLSLYIKPLLLPKGEYIVRKGDIGEEMFFINRGVVEVVSEHVDPIVFDTMASGRFFGEISTIFSCPRTASVRTQTNADLFVLKKKDLDVVLGHYPNIKKQIMETAEERQRLVKERAKVAAAKKAEEERKKAAVLIAAMRRFSIAAAEHSQVTGLAETGQLVPTALVDDEEQSDGEHSNDDREAKSRDVDCSCFPALLNIIKEGFADLREKMSFTISLDSKLNWWTTLNVPLIVLHFLCSSYMASFQHHLFECIMLNVVIDVSCYIEIFLKAHMSYLDEMGDEVTDQKEIWLHYRRGQFTYDIISNFPLWLVAFALPDWKMYYAYFSLVQVLRLKRVNDYFKQALKQLDVNILLARMMDNIVQVIVLLQISSCIWFLVAQCDRGEDKDSNKNLTCAVESWMEKRLAFERKHGEIMSPFKIYTDTVYWALATMTSTGYGDISVSTKRNLEMIIASMVMLLGKITFGFVLGNIASTMANMETLRVLFEERYNGVISHMESLRMPEYIRIRVINIFQYMWSRNKGSSTEGIFETLPSCLHAELCFDLTGDAMKSVPIFRNCDLAFIRALCQKTQLLQYYKNEFIFRKGDIGHEMYFIKSGVVEIDDGPYKVGLGEGDFFGEEALTRRAPRNNSARAISHVDMFYLRDSDLADVFRSYPEEAIRVRQNIGEDDRRSSYLGDDAK